MNTDQKINLAFFTMIAICGLAFIGVNVYNGFYPKNDTVTFNVIGVTDPVNATTLTQLHYECIKYCAYTFREDYQKQKQCYDQCSLLGKEGLP